MLQLLFLTIILYIIIQHLMEETEDSKPLIKVKKNVTIITPNEYPEFLRWLPGNKKVLPFNSNQKKAAKLILESDLIFTLDFNNYSRLEGLGELLDKATAKKTVEKHPFLWKKGYKKIKL